MDAAKGMLRMGERGRFWETSGEEERKSIRSKIAFLLGFLRVPFLTIPIAGGR